jgi:hypothetical protein
MLVKDIPLDPVVAATNELLLEVSDKGGRRGT